MRNRDLPQLPTEAEGPIQVGRFTIYPDGTMSPAISGGDGPVEGEQPAEGGDAPAEGEGGDAPADPPAEGDAPADGGEGGETPTDAVVEFQLPADVDTFDDPRLVELSDEIQAQIDAGTAAVAEARLAGTARLADVTSLRTLRTAQERIRTLLEGRVAERAEIDAGLAELGEPVALPEGIEAPSRAAAAATVVRVIGDRPAAPRQAAGDQQASQVVASAESPWRDATQGGVQADWAEMFNQGRLPDSANVEQHLRRPSILASARVIDDESTLLTDSPSHNERVIADAMANHRAAREEAASGGAIMAAICDPASILRDAFVCGTTATPLQSRLVSLTAQSGNQLKYQYRTPTSIAGAVAGMGQWSEALQTSIDPTDPATWKPIVAIACAAYNTETATELTAGYEVDAYTELSSPESVADFVQAKDRAFARHTEGWYLRKLDTFLHHFTYDAQAALAGAGAVPEVITAVLSALARGDYAERLELASGYTVFGSPGLLYALVIDENKKGHRTDAASSMAEVQNLVSEATGTDYVQLLDVPHSNGNGGWGTNPFGNLPSPGGGGTTLPSLSALTFTLRVIDTSSFAAFTTGEATFGDQITLDQARQNKRGFFQRIFAGLMKPGCAPGYKITITNLHSDGSRGGFLIPDSDASS